MSNCIKYQVFYMMVQMSLIVKYIYTWRQTLKMASQLIYNKEIILQYKKTLYFEKKHFTVWYTMALEIIYFLCW